MLKNLETSCWRLGDEDTSSAQIKNEQTSELDAEWLLADSARCAKDREGDEDTSIAQVHKKKKSRSAHGTDVARVSENRKRSQLADSSTAQVQKKKKSRSAHGTDVARVSEDRERSQRADSNTAQVDADVKACNEVPTI